MMAGCRQMMPQRRPCHDLWRECQKQQNDERSAGHQAAPPESPVSTGASVGSLAAIRVPCRGGNGIITFFPIHNRCPRRTSPPDGHSMGCTSNRNRGVDAKPTSEPRIKRGRRKGGSGRPIRTANSSYQRATQIILKFNAATRCGEREKSITQRRKDAKEKNMKTERLGTERCSDPGRPYFSVPNFSVLISVRPLRLCAFA